MTLLRPTTQGAITEAVDLLLSHLSEIPTNHLHRMLECFGQYLPDQNTQAYGADFDLKKQLDFQVKTVTAMRDAVLTSDNRIQEGMTTRDVNELNKASTALTASIMKHHKELINMDRMRAVEEATMAVMAAWPEEADRMRFLRVLEEELELLE